MSFQNLSASSPTSAARKPSAAPAALANNPIDLTGSDSEQEVQSGELLQNPFFTIMASAPYAQEGIKHTAFGLLPQALEAPAGISVLEQATYYQKAIAIEQDNQLNLLLCILAVDPDVDDKSYLNLRALLYQKWGERVSNEISDANDRTLHAHQRLRTDPPTAEQLGESKTQLKRLSKFMTEMLESRSAGYRALGPSDRITPAGEDRFRQQTAILGRAMLEVLKGWTMVWEADRARAERRCFRKDGSPAPFPADALKLDAVGEGELLFQIPGLTRSSAVGPRGSSITRIRTPEYRSPGYLENCTPVTFQRPGGLIQPASR